MNPQGTPSYRSSPQNQSILSGLSLIGSSNDTGSGSVKQHVTQNMTLLYRFWACCTQHHCNIASSDYADLGPVEQHVTPSFWFYRFRAPQVAAVCASFTLPTTMVTTTPASAVMVTTPNLLPASGYRSFSFLLREGVGMVWDGGGKVCDCFCCCCEIRE